MSNELIELTVYKNKDGKWIAKDKDGKSATGLTRQNAVNMYHMIYDFKYKDVSGLLHDIEKEL